MPTSPRPRAPSNGRPAPAPRRPSGRSEIRYGQVPTAIRDLRSAISLLVPAGPTIASAAPATVSTATATLAAFTTTATTALTAAVRVGRRLSRRVGSAFRLRQQLLHRE